ncbi:hypothetical protein ACUN3E_09725 [Streptomyces sp. Ju416(a)]|uniref:hypothetical protein n=1 Tax=unclassified Streptomyces TaxID=2593676 RepID=UPI000D518674|nr:hypothetical protein [Streptomyces sp. CS014]PVC98482.1 hypothetical protein DBP12_10530 [Streptomyces sp. CS014]
MDSTDSSNSSNSSDTSNTSNTSNGEVKSLPFAVTLVVSAATAVVCGELFGFPWWQRLITVVVVVMALEGVNQAVGRARARRRSF